MTTIYLLTQPNERLAFYTTFDKDEAKARAAETGEVLLCFDVYRAADSSLNTSNILPSRCQQGEGDA